jgi:hypothetical protein
VVIKSCKGLVKDDLFMLIGIQSSLVPKSTVTAPVAITTAEKEDGPAEDIEKTEKTVCRFFDFFWEVKEEKKDEKTAQIIPIKRKNQLTSASVRCAEISSQNKFCLFRHLNQNGCG